MRKTPVTLCLLVILGCTKATVPTQDYASDFARAALRLESENQNEKADLLESLAFAQMRRDPTQVPAMWLVVKDRIYELKDNPEEQMSRLDAFATEVRASLPECPSLNIFNAAWEVLEAIEKADADAKVTLCKSAQSQLASLQEKSAGPSTSFADDLTMLFSLINPSVTGGSNPGLESILSSVLGAEQDEIGGHGIDLTPNPDFQQLQKQMSDVLLAILGKGKALLEQQNVILADEAQKDTKGESVEPTSTNPGGYYQQVMTNCESIQKQIEVSGISRWSGIVEGNLSEELENIATGMMSLGSKAAELQVVRYNVWALRQMHMTESAQSWPDILGVVDLRALDPSVSSVYSLTYENLIRKETDPMRRDNLIRTLLSKEKVRLEQF